MALIAVLMFGFGFAMVPFYNAFCEWTGLNGKVKTTAAVEEAYVIDLSREVNVEFMTSVNGDMPLVFTVEKSKIKVHPGEYQTMIFYGENTSDHDFVGRAVPSIAPGLATQYFKKIQCFCFDEQTFKAHEKKAMPVRFVIRPDIPELMKDVTLAYTFYEMSRDDESDDQKQQGQP